VSDVALEVNFDALVGPTHNYAALSYGNIAAMSHGGEVANPRAAALQGLEKMKLLSELGVPQAVLPPHERPDVGPLRRVGFAGSDAEVIESAARHEPGLLAAVSSASAMWAANAATVSPSADAGDGRVHFTAANLASFFHRSLEAATTSAVLRAVFADEALFAHHAPVPATGALGDEGAANHTRLCREHGGAGVEVFSYGADGDRDVSRDAADSAHPSMAARFPARQMLAASRAVARMHGIDPGAVVFARQSSEAIDAGVFHNDVIAVGHRDVLLCHQRAFADRQGFFDELRAKLSSICELRLVEVREDELTLSEAVSTYLFNSQLVTTATGELVLICPAEVEGNARSRAVVEELIAGASPIAAVHYVGLRQSMRNGGGPACLRLRVALTARERAAMNAGVVYSPELHTRLVGWIARHYRDRLAPADLADPSLLEESRRALDELTAVLGLPGVYPFQSGA
jgi:succinylarginine dihydrolase